MSDKEDPWKEALSKKLEKMAPLVLKEFEEWNAAEGASATRDAADNFNPERVLLVVEKSCIEISRWYIQEHNKLIKNVCRDAEIKPSPWLLEKDDNWLSNELFSEKKTLETALNNIKKEMQSKASYLEKNTGFLAGVKQFIDSVIKGLISPKRSIYDFGKALLGGFEVPKAQKIDNDYNKAFENLDSAFECFGDAVFAKFGSRWNDKTIGAIKDIENSLLGDVGTRGIIDDISREAESALEYAKEHPVKAIVTTVKIVGKLYRIFGG